MLMAIGAVVVVWLLPPASLVVQRSALRDPLRALKHPGLLGVAITALRYNFGFFTLLAYTPFPLDMNAQQVGLVFFGWGMMLAFVSVVLAPRLQGIVGTLPAITIALAGYLGETINDHVPYWVGAAAVLSGMAVLLASRHHLRHIDESHGLPTGLIDAQPVSGAISVLAKA